MLSVLKNLYYTKTVWHNLVNDFLTNKMASAYIFAGPKGIGKAQLAKELIKYLIKADETTEARIDDESFLDLLVIDKKEKSEIGIDQIRSAVDFFAHTPAESQYKFVIIDNADELNLNAANSLLKILEEPPKHTFFFLITSTPNKLLKTIRSRSRMVRFSPFAFKEMQLVMNTSAIFFMEDFVAGSVDRACKFDEYKALELYSTILQLVQQEDILEFNKFCENFVKSNQVWQLIVSLIEYLLSRCIKFSTNCLELARMQDLEKAVIPSLIKTKNLDSWFKIYDAFLSDTKQADIFNLDKKQLILRIFNKIRAPSNFRLNNE